MIQTRHDFFSDPQWPHPNATSVLRANSRTPSELSVKEEEKSVALINLPMQSPSLFDLNPTPSNHDQPVERLKGTLKEEERSFSVERNFVVQADKFLQSSMMQSESSHLENHLKIEEFSSENEDAHSYTNEASFGIAKYRILSRDVKQFLIDEVDRTSVTHVSKKYGISANNLSRWKKRLERRSGAGRKIADKDMEEMLITWLQQEMKNNSQITRKDVQNKALCFSKNHQFKASKGWFERFVKRNRNLHLMEYFGMKLKAFEPSYWQDMEETTLHHLFEDYHQTEIKPLEDCKISSYSIRRSKRLEQSEPNK